LFCTPADLDDIVVTAPDAASMPGKEFKIKNLASGSGTVTVVILPGSIELGAGEVLWVRAKANVSEPAYPDFTILYTNGAVT